MKETDSLYLVLSIINPLFQKSNLKKKKNTVVLVCGIDAQGSATGNGNSRGRAGSFVSSRLVRKNVTLPILVVNRSLRTCC